MKVRIISLKMEQVQSLRMHLLPASNINESSGSSSRNITLTKRLALCFIILEGLGLLYVLVYYPAQDRIYGPAQFGNVCTYIRPGYTTTILSPKAICSDEPYLLIVVYSSVANFHARLAIRHTWGNKSNLNKLYDFSVRIAFLLGLNANNTLNSYATDESNLYNDIVQESFHDTYNNLTIKSVMLLKWVTANCDKLTYLMKTDDDVFVNVPALVKTLKARTQSNGTLIGSLLCDAQPIRDPKDKWYCPKYVYPGRTYPNFLSGSGYVMSLDVAGKLYKLALSTPLLHLEDLYITGICARRAGIEPANHYDFYYISPELESCGLRRAITVHKGPGMYRLWAKLNGSSVARCSLSAVQPVFNNRAHQRERCLRQQARQACRIFPRRESRSPQQTSSCSSPLPQSLPAQLSLQLLLVPLLKNIL